MGEKMNWEEKEFRLKALVDTQKIIIVAQQDLIDNYINMLKEKIELL